ncbi:SusC/RagA family TonB-linked outer membrane protein [Cellulophaga baltica]|uniref:SusC/RagA family TonB-linked outer membrane protein n=1 Tax=Cellulophaga baltica TaxID=76594 RepID=UPI0037CA6CD1
MKKKDKLWRRILSVFSLLMILVVQQGYAQGAITGTVIDEQGTPVPGVSILKQGTKEGSVADFDGNFAINASKGEVLVFSSIGFKTQKVTVGASSNVRIVLIEDTELLNEVVVVGYGTQKKKEITGSVANVSSETIVKTATSDLGTALQGKVAGVNIQAGSGRPGESANVQIRGLGSISSGGLGPLYVVDGIPFDGNPNIAPEQIESIDILKDGASAAVYGVRASNGVILITTKKGKAGKMKIDISTYTGIQNITSGTPLMNTTEQLYELEQKTELLGTEPLTFFLNANVLDYDSNFVEEVQNDNAVIQNLDVNISGGVENLTLNFNTNYFKQEGVLINSGFNRLTNRFTGQFTKGKFKAFASMGYSVENRDQEPFALYEYAIAQAPWNKPLKDIPSVGQNSVELDVDNDILFSFLSRQLDNVDEREVKSDNIALSLEYEIIDGLKYKINLGRNSYNYFRKFFKPQYLAFTNQGVLNATASNVQASLNEDYTFSKRETIENIVTYDKSFNKHNFNFTGVISYEEFNSRALGVGVIYSEDASNDLQTLGSGAEGIKPSSINVNSTLAGKLARLQYNFDEKYLFSASIRHDGSSNFTKDNRYGSFPSVSIGWNISEENFFKNITSVNSLKIRASWAELGNQNTGAAYSAIPIIESGVNYPFGPNEELGFGNIQRRYANSDLKWETTISKNIGIDLSMFQNKLSITADVYENNKEDMLLQERLPASSGTYQPRAASIYSVRTVNAGNMVNKGLEIAASYKDRIGDDFKYTISGTFTKNKNEVLDLNGVERGYANGRPIVSQGTNVDYTTFLAEGYEAGAFFLVQNDGVIKTQEQLDTYKLIDGGAQLGDLMMIDQLTIDSDNDGIADQADGKIDDNDRVYSGSGQADFEAGLNLSLDYKGFDFYAQTYFSYGAEIYNGAKLYAYGGGRHKDLYSMWTPQNPDSDIPTDRQNAFHNNVRARSDYFLEDGTYFRIRTLTLGYTIPGITETSGIEKVRLYLTSVNPFTFTDYTGYDPEVGGDGIFTRGVDRGNYPVTRQFMLGVQLSF